MPAWTKEQLEAIYKDNTNIIVSAGAGSGKTAVLSERVIRKLKDGVHVNELLILTFTNAAAAEMKNRIRNKIKKEDTLKEELNLIDNAYITTFDSFALSIVKKYHYLLNVSKNVGIVEDLILDIKSKEILTEIFEEYYEKENPLFINLVDTFCLKDDDLLKQYIININKKLDLLIDKSDYLNNYFNNLDLDGDINDYLNVIKSRISSLEEELNNISFCVDNDYYEKLKNLLINLINSVNYIDIRNNFNIKLPNLPRNSSEEAKKIKKNISDTLKELKLLCEYQDELELKNSIYKTYDYIKIIIEIIFALDKRISLYKQKYDMYSFNDIAHLAIKVVKDNENVRLELKNSFKEIMIDEYQDTSDIQEEFINLISNNNIYMVGDIKQSIYRFRNANPLIFKSKYDNYSNNINGLKIDLNKNFRSREEVLNNINIIFNAIMDDIYGGANYIESHQMIFGNSSYNNEGLTNNNNNCEIYIYDYDKDNKYKKEEIEAFIIANDIKNKIENNYLVYDKDNNVIRKVEYTDFVVLMDRSTNFDLYKKIFEYNNIPLNILKDENMNNDIDILVLSNLLNFIICVNNNDFNSEFKYSFISILRSFIYEYDDNKIFNYFIDNNYKDTDLYKKAKLISLKIDNTSISGIIEMIIQEFNFYENIIKVGDINNTFTKIKKLYDMSKSLSDLSYTIYDFNSYLKQITKDNLDILYNIDLSSDNSVKIMTIHKSKGLEYPICYFSGLDKKFNLTDTKDKFLFDNKYGIITPYVDDDIKDTIYKVLIKNKNIEDEISEKIRLLYVAVTRCKEKMIFIMPSQEDYNATNNLIVDNSIRSKYRSFSDILNSVYLKTKDYYKKIDVDSISLSKDYDIIKSINYHDKLNKIDSKLLIEDIDIKAIEINENKFSKNINNIINENIYKNIELGNEFHKTLEYINLKNVNYDLIDNKFVKDKIKTMLNNKLFNNIKNSKIYQEYEFVYEQENIISHGIIDLMLEYDNYIDIIDYKLKNINDELYLNQLKGYKKYIESISNKKVNIYLYSIIDSSFNRLN